MITTSTSTVLEKHAIRDNQVTYAVTSSFQGHTYHKKVRLLPPRTTTRDVASNTFLGHFVKEMHLTKKGSAKHLATVVDP